MNLEAMRQLTQKMQQTNDSKIVDETDAEEEAEKLFNLAVACEDEDPQKAFELFKKAAELGNVEAMFATGIRYYRGEGTEQDTTQSFAWCKKAAENGQVNAMNWVGEFYRDGEGVVQNIQNAVEWLKKSSDGGNNWASLNLARMYRDGTGVKQNFREALHWFEQSSRNDNAIAFIELGDMFRDGVGVEENLSQAVDCYIAAANLGDSFAPVRLGDLYLYNEEVRDHAEAFRMYKIAADRGNSYGFSGLGTMYYSGCHVSQSYSKAVELHEKALELDGRNCRALKELAFCYKCGDGVRENYSKAYELYRRAAELGDGEAMYRLSQMHEFGEGVEQDLNVAEELANRARAMGYTPQVDKGPCFITTAVCENFGKPDDCHELTTFRNFRDTWLATQPDGKSLIAEYYAVAPKIVDKINRLPNAAQVYKNLLREYLAPCLAFIESGDNLSCKRLYVEMVTSLKKKFLS